MAAGLALLLVMCGLTAAMLSVFGGPAPAPLAPIEAPTALAAGSAPPLPAPEPTATPTGTPTAPPSAGRSSGRSSGARASSGASARVTGDARAETAAVGLINVERTRAGCRQPLRVHDRLRTAARAHSRDLAAHNLSGHTGSDGSTPEQRMRRAGFTQPVAETVARGPRAAADVLGGWLADPVYRQVLLDCTSRTIGVGVMLRNGTEAFWTADTGR